MLLQIFENHGIRIPEDIDAETTWDEGDYGTRRIPGQTERNPTEKAGAEKKHGENGAEAEQQNPVNKPTIVFGKAAPTAWAPRGSPDMTGAQTTGGRKALMTDDNTLESDRNGSRRSSSGTTSARYLHNSGHR